MNDGIRHLATHIRKRWTALTSERASWLGVWQDVQRFVVPDMGRFSTSDRNKGERRDEAILDNSATRALRTLAAGLIAGLSSPAQPWFELATPIAGLRDDEQVKAWLHDVRDVLQNVFHASNVYRALHSIYEELGGFGTGAGVIMEDFDTVLHVHTLTAGEYALATDAKGRVNTLYREFDMTVDQLVREFGLSSVSAHVRQMYERGDIDQWITVLHAIEPRPVNERTARLGAQADAFREVYVEKAADEKKVLRESGYASFIVIAPRWIVSGGNVYGTAPARDALGDVKQLQHEQLRKSQAIDYQTKPPLQAPTSMKGAQVDTMPGGVSYADAGSPQGGIRPLFEVRLDLSALLADIQDTRQRIGRAFYEDLFRMVTDLDRSGITARQIAEQHAEKMMLLGPVIERVQNEALQPLIERGYAIAAQAGILPEPPESAQGAPLKVEFVSILAQAQKQAGAGAVDRLIGTIGAIANLKPDALDRIDADAVVEEYAGMLGTSPKLLVPRETAIEQRVARAQAQAEQAQAAAMQQQAATMKDAASVASALETSSALGA